MQDFDTKVNLMLISNRPCRASMMHDIMRQVDISGVIRRLPPTQDAIDCARRNGAYRAKKSPDLIFVDYASPDKKTTALLREIAFGRNKAIVPVVLLTSPESALLLDAGDIDGGDAVMFSPTGLASFIGKMCRERRKDFFKALQTLYQFGPILVRTPSTVLSQDSRELAISA